MVRPAHVGLEVPEEPFNGVRVDLAADVDALRVLDVLRDREAQNQRRYNQSPRSSQTPGRPEKDW